MQPAIASTIIQMRECFAKPLHLVATLSGQKPCRILRNYNHV